MFLVLARGTGSKMSRRNGLNNGISEFRAYWSFWVVKSLGMPINTYLCSIYYIYDTKNAFSAGQISP
jgi:hypothetical protein